MSKLQELAERVIDVDFYGAKDADATIDSVMLDIAYHPESVIEYLLDMIDDLQS